MTIIYSTQQFIGVMDASKPSVFLGGGTPRRSDVVSWRKEALKYFESTDYNVFVPEPKNGLWNLHHEKHIEWELAAMEECDYILFWVPRDMVDMICLTTNFEMGYWLGASRMNKYDEYEKHIFYGRPPEAKNTGYNDFVYEKCVGMKPHETLEDLCLSVIDEIEYNLISNK